MGGVGLNDPSMGLQYQVWTLDYVGGQVRITAPNQAAPTVLFEAEDITEVSLAFDQNMRPFVAYVQNGEAKFYCWDTATSSVAFTTLPTGSVTPKACLDDKRQTQTVLSDIILAYMRDKALYMRKQRDRYQIEYLLADNLDAKLVKLGMTDKNRVQFKLQPNV